MSGCPTKPRSLSEYHVFHKDIVIVVPINFITLPLNSVAGLNTLFSISDPSLAIMSSVPLRSSALFILEITKPPLHPHQAFPLPLPLPLPLPRPLVPFESLGETMEACCSILVPPLFFFGSSPFSTWSSAFRFDAR